MRRLLWGTARGALCTIATVGLLTAVLSAAPARAATFVDCDASQSLQDGIDAAPAGSVVKVTGTCDGSVFVNKRLTIQGNPTATLDAHDLGRVIEGLIGASSTLRLVHLAITGGVSEQGSGVRMDNGNLTLDHVTVRDNLATGSTDAEAGGVFVPGRLTIVDSSIVHNRAVATNISFDEVSASGGGAFVGGVVSIVRSTIAFNHASAVSNGSSAAAFGGGIDAENAGSVTITRSHVDSNEVSAQAGSAVARGGGLFLNRPSAPLTISNSTLNDDNANGVATGASDAIASGGGLGGTIGQAKVLSRSVLARDGASADSQGNARSSGGAIDLSPSGLTLSSSQVVSSDALAKAVHAATVNGGGIRVFAPTTITGSRVVSNVVRVESGDAAALGRGGAISSEAPLTLRRSTIDENRVVVSSSDSTATANGGAVALGAKLTMAQSTVGENFATARADTGGMQAEAMGGGLYLEGGGADTIVNSTLVRDSVSVVTDPAVAEGGGILFKATSLAVTSSTIAGDNARKAGGIDVLSGAVTLKGTLLGKNSANPGPDCRGHVTSQGNNLIQHTTGCTITPKSSDVVGQDPKLGLVLLANNGGPTPTVKPALTSPAVDTIAKVACPEPTDQRGVKRPQGPACDIGAVEITHG